MQKITRCSDQGAVIADMLSIVSKAWFGEASLHARRNGGHWQPEPARVPGVLLEWVAAPHPDDDLGHRLLMHLAAGGVPVLGYSREFA